MSASHTCPLLSVFLGVPQEEQISDELEIDHRIHSRLIGARGKAISKVMDRFKVDIRFPRDKTSSTVVITGLVENVEDVKEHLMALTEDYVSDDLLLNSDGVDFTLCVVMSSSIIFKSMINFFF